MKNIALLATTVASAFALTSCGPSESQSDTAATPKKAAPAPRTMKICGAPDGVQLRDFADNGTFLGITLTNGTVVTVRDAYVRPDPRGQAVYRSIVTPQGRQGFVNKDNLCAR